jgi:hypothetical protein
MTTKMIFQEFETNKGITDFARDESLWALIDNVA